MYSDLQGRILVTCKDFTLSPLLNNSSNLCAFEIFQTADMSHRSGVDSIWYDWNPLCPVPCATHIHKSIGTSENLIFSCLSALDLIRFSFTCRKAHQCVKDYNKVAYNIQNLLSQYFPESRIDTFHELQAKTGTLISGSTALQFFERLRFEGSDLDLYVEAKNVRDLCYFLKDCGYLFYPRERQDSDLDAAIAQKYRQARNSSDTPHDYYHSAGIGSISSVLNFRRDGKTIQVISSREDESPLSIILSFHSSKCSCFVLGS